MRGKSRGHFIPRREAKLSALAKPMRFGPVVAFGKLEIIHFDSLHELSIRQFPGTLFRKEIFGRDGSR